MSIDSVNVRCTFVDKWATSETVSPAVWEPSVSHQSAQSSCGVRREKLRRKHLACASRLCEPFVSSTVRSFQEARELLSRVKSA